MLTFIELPAFERHRERYLPDDSFRALQQVLSRRPDAGDLIQGTGGLRKIRWRVPGRGKSGGIRVIYYWATQQGDIFLFTLFGKGDVSDLSQAEKNRFRRALRKTLEEYYNG